jgi:hypothetical protein
MVIEPGTRRWVRQPLLPGLIGLALVLSACTGSGAVSGAVSGTGGTPTAPTQIRQVASIATLRDAFNADAGATRLILLVSPT